MARVGASQVKWDLRVERDFFQNEKNFILTILEAPTYIFFEPGRSRGQVVQRARPRLLRDLQVLGEGADRLLRLQRAGGPRRPRVDRERLLHAARGLARPQLAQPPQSG